MLCESPVLCVCVSLFVCLSAVCLCESERERELGGLLYLCVRLYLCVCPLARTSPDGHQTRPVAAPSVYVCVCARVCV